MTAASETTRASRRWCGFVCRLGLVLLFSALVALLVIMFARPREYFAKTVLEVKPDNSRAMGKIFGDNRRRGIDRDFVRTQAHLLQTKTILYPVIEDLQLIDYWSRDGRKLQLETAHLKLRRMLDIRVVRGTNLIEIGVFSPESVEAANIANTIAVRYRNQRLTQLQKRCDNELAQLKEEIGKLEKRVHELRSAMIASSRDIGMIDPDPEHASSLLPTTEGGRVATQKQLEEQRLVVARLESESEAIRPATPEDSKERSTEAIKLAIEKRVLASLEARLKNLKQTQTDEQPRVIEYLNTKGDFLRAKAFLQAAQDKWSTENLERGIDFEPATVWEKAEASLYRTRRPFRRVWNAVAWRWMD